jgi:UDP-3-O-[3-hydroxymyristoyl] glucosamine N-acyltransferase
MIQLPKVTINVRLSEIASFLEAPFFGEDFVLDGFNLSNRDIKADSVISYCASEQYLRIATKNEKVKAIIVPKALYEHTDNNTKQRFSFITSENPEWAFYHAFIHFIERKRYAQYSWETNINGATLLPGAIIEHGVILGKNVVIGNNSVVKSGTIIGDNVTIGACSVIGSDGFQLIKDPDGNNHAIPHVGRTYIGNNVTIADNVTVSRTLFEGYTTVSDFVKIDSQAHIAHNCEIGINSVICANTTLLGSCTVGKNVWIAPNCLIMNRVKIGDGAFICSASFVMANVRPETKVFGIPARKVE